MTETFQHPLIHTPDPRQRTIERMAQAGFVAYFGKRPHTWATDPEATRILWRLVAGEVYDGTIRDPRGLRDRYQDGHYGAPSWTPTYVLIWQGVLSAMRCVIGTTEQAA